MPYDNLQQASKALAIAIRDKAETLTFSPASETVDLLEGAALVKASQQVESVAYMLPDEFTTDPWDTPSDWLTMPELQPENNVFMGIMAVYPGGGSAFAFAATGNFTVEWGDGVVENYTSGSTAHHAYDYDSFDLEGTTITSDGFKQAMVRIYPQPGTTLSSLDFTKKPTYTNSGMQLSNFTYVSVASDTLTVFNLRGSSTTTATSYSLLAKLVIAVTSSINFSYFAYGVPSLKQVVLKEAKGSFISAFQACTSLERAYIDVKSDALSNMFDGCTALRDIEMLRISSAASSASLSYMFANCTALGYCPDVYCTGSVNASYMFAGSGLVVTPIINTPGSFNGANMFSNSSRLKHARSQTSSCSDARSMYTSCKSLARIDPIELSGFSVDSMFSGCSLESPPKVVVTGAQSLSSFFSGAKFRRSVHSEWLTVTTGSITSYYYMYSGAYCPIIVVDTLHGLNAINYMFNGTSVTSLVLPDLSAYTTGNTVSMSFGSRLSYFEAPNIPFSFSVASQNLGAKALNIIFENLPIVTDARNVTVTGNYGITESGYDPTIATAKGWTVTA